MIVLSLFSPSGSPSALCVSPISPSMYPAGHLPRPPSSPSGPQQLLDQVARHAVEEEAQHDEQQQGQHHLDDQPLVAVAHQVADGFQRAQEPQEGGVWATRGRGWRGLWLMKKERHAGGGKKELMKGE